MPTYITKDGLEKLKKELDYLKNVKRFEVAKKIKDAASFGDLSENSEYTEAKENQAFVEGRIQELENLVREALIINISKKEDRVYVGSTIRVVCAKQNETFNIVGADDVQPKENKISSESPLGQAFIGKKKGDIVILETPAGDRVQYKIMEIK